MNQGSNKPTHKRGGAAFRFAPYLAKSKHATPKSAFWTVSEEGTIPITQRDLETDGELEHSPRGTLGFFTKAWPKADGTTSCSCSCSCSFELILGLVLTINGGFWLGRVNGWGKRVERSPRAPFHEFGKPKIIRPTRQRGQSRTHPESIAARKSSLISVNHIQEITSLEVEDDEEVASLSTCVDNSSSRFRFPFARNTNG